MNQLAAVRFRTCSERAAAAVLRKRPDLFRLVRLDSGTLMVAPAAMDVDEVRRRSAALRAAQMQCEETIVQTAFEYVSHPARRARGAPLDEVRSETELHRIIRRGDLVRVLCRPRHRHRLLFTGPPQYRVVAVADRWD